MSRPVSGSSERQGEDSKKWCLATRQWAAETSQEELTRDAVHLTVELGLKLNTAMKGTLAEQTR